MERAVGMFGIADRSLDAAVQEINALTRFRTRLLFAVVGSRRSFNPCQQDARRPRERRRAAAMAARPRRLLLLLACCACTCSGFDFFSGFGGGGMPGGMQGGGTPDREYYDLLGVAPC